MRALRWFGRYDVRLDDAPMPEPGPHDLILQVGYCGICGTDFEEYTSGPLFIPTSPHPLTGAMAPITLGHEFAGVVAARGTAVSDFGVGDRVVPEIALFCGACRYCARGQHALCERWAAVGIHCDGGLADYVRVEARTCVALPEQITDIEAALLEPLEVAVRAVRKLGEIAGTTVLVTGAGPIGLLTIQVLRAYGAATVVVAEPRESRRRAALALGADGAYLPDSFSAVVDSAVECSGASTGIRLAVQSVRKAGRVVLVGIPTRAVEIDLLPLLAGEKTVIGSIQHEVASDLRPAIDLVRRSAVNVKSLVTEMIPLSGAAEAFEKRTSRPADATKILIDCRA